MGRTYCSVYEAVSGRHPAPRPWHFQWLPGTILYRDLREILASLRGSVLDVGCGSKPYRSWVPHADRYVGLDVADGPNVDVVISPSGRWPLPDEDFESVICTQVLEHTSDPADTLAEIARVLKPGGRAVITVPFAYNEHGVPHDYRRLTVNGAVGLLGARFDVVETRKQGGVGSTLGTFFLNWLDAEATLAKSSRVARAALLPLWLGLCAIVNLGGYLLDRLDRTGAFYGNVLLVAAKRH